VILATLSTLTSFSNAWLQSPTPLYSNQAGGPSLSAGWASNPSSSATKTVRLAETNGLKFAYADYWTAYVLDALGDGRLVVTDPHNNRSAAAYRAVQAAPDPVWLFLHPSLAATAQHAFPRTRIGPDNYSEADFVEALGKRGITYRVTQIGVLDAIIPAHKVTPAEIGMPPPEHGRQ
jgi:hypothetical protein